jgi:hypothetical protein
VVSGLKVSFFKSKFYGINLDDNLLSVASSFLHCEVGSIPFHFLGFLSNTIIRSPVNIFFEIKVFPIVVSRLKVNFFKSKFYGINLDDNFLSIASSFFTVRWILSPFAF